MNPESLPRLKFRLRESGPFEEKPFEQIVEVLTIEDEPVGQILVAGATYVLKPRNIGVLSVDILVERVLIEGHT